MQIVDKHLNFNCFTRICLRLSLTQFIFEVNTLMYSRWTIV